jgi:hypothetical protein
LLVATGDQLVERWPEGRCRRQVAQFAGNSPLALPRLARSCIVLRSICRNILPPQHTAGGTLRHPGGSPTFPSDRGPLQGRTLQHSAPSKFWAASERRARMQRFRFSRVVGEQQRSSRAAAELPPVLWRAARVDGERKRIGGGDNVGCPNNLPRA